MAYATIELRTYIEAWSQATPDIPLDQKITSGLPHLFDFYFPIWDENYRFILERKIVMHYYTRELGYETPALFKLYLNERLNLIMPYYNQLYKTTVNDFDYLTDVNYTESENRNLTENTNGSVNGVIDNTNTTTTNETEMNTEKSNSSQVSDGSTNQTNTGKELRSDLPQANYANVDYGTQLNETDNTQNGTSKNTDTIDSTTTNNINRDMSVEDNGKSTNNTTTTNDTRHDETISRSKKGLSGSRSFTDLLIQYRESLINIDNMVINELSDLFMTIW